MGIAGVLGAYLLRDMRTVRSYRVIWVLGFVDGIFQLMVFYYLSRLIEVPSLEVVPGHDVGYFSFVVVGLALNNFLMTGIHLFATSMRSEQASGTLEVLFALPTSPVLTLFGMGTYDLAWSFITTAFFMVVAIGFFGLRLVTEPLALLAAGMTVVLSVVLYASLGIAIAAFTLVFKRANALNGIIVQSLALLSGVFFPIDLLPRPLQWLAAVVPFAWALDTLRKTLLAGDIPLVRIGLLLIAGLLALPVALWLFHLAYDVARRQGSLAQY